MTGLSNLNVKDNSLWKMAKGLVRKSNLNKVPTLHGKKGLAISDTDKTEVLADHYELVHYLIQDYGDPGTDGSVNKKYREIATSLPDLVAIELVTPKEIRLAVMRTGSRKAPGHDGMQNILLKNLPKKAYVQINYIFNACLKLCHFPDRWKIANILPFHKTGKDKLFAASYRPISLLRSLAKIFERIIFNRILAFENKHKMLISEQFGFRQKRSRVQQLIRLVNTISTNLNKNKTTAMVLLDLEKAFDTVWHKGLIYKLNELKFPIYLIKLAQKYLSGRKFRVLINGTKSEYRDIKAGVPQRSILGPLLFIYYINDIPMSQNVSRSLFADDTSLYTASWSPKLTLHRLQSATNQTLEFFDKWKLSVNIEKTELVVFTRKNFNHQNRKVVFPDFIICNNVIKPVTVAKYLGVSLHHKLTHNEHISSALKKAQKMLRILYCLMCRRSRLRIKNKLFLYKMIIRTILLYAAPVWSG